MPVRTVPGAHYLDQPLAQGFGLEYAAIEQDGVRPLVRLELAVQEGGQVAGDGRVVHIRQAHFLEAGTGRSRRLGVPGNQGEEAFQNRLLDVGECNLSVERTTDDGAPAALHGNRDVDWRVWGEQCFLRLSARLDQH